MLNMIVLALQLATGGYEALDAEARIAQAKSIIRSGEASTQTCVEIANTITEQLDSLDRKDKRGREIGWAIQAVAAGCGESYRPLAKRATLSVNEDVASDALGALRVLDSKLPKPEVIAHPDSIRLLTESRAEKCAFVKQLTCSTRKDPEDCMSDLRRDGSKAGADSMMVVGTGGTRRLWGLITVTVDFYNCSAHQ